MPQACCVAKHRPRCHTRQHAVINNEDAVHLAVWNCLRNARQLTKKEMRRTVLGPAIYIVVLAIFLVVINSLGSRYDEMHPDQLLMVLYLTVASFLMTIPQVRIERGRLSLYAIVTGAAAILTNPLDTTMIGLVASLSQVRRGPWPTLGNAVMSATAACLGGV